MPGGMSVKPGDVVMSHSGKSILVERTENEGEIILADVLSLSSNYKPCLVINVASLCREYIEITIKRSQDEMFYH